jgi:hypothetical protein
LPKNLPHPGECGVETTADPRILMGTTPLSMLIYLLKKRFSEKKVKTPERICRPCGSIGAKRRDVLLPDACYPVAFSTMEPYKILSS